MVGEACGQIQQGSGFVGANGLIVTNAHVVAGERSPTVESGGVTEEDWAMMLLSEAERDRLLVFLTAELARARRRRGLRLNVGT